MQNLSHFLLFKDQLTESRRQKAKENSIPSRKFRPVENDPEVPIEKNFTVLFGHTGLTIQSNMVWILLISKLVFPAITVCTHVQKRFFAERNSDTVT